MTPNKQVPKTRDPRALRTRNALLAAVRELILEGQQPEGIRASALAARAGVSRSTLYAHFAGPEGVISKSIAAPFAVLANALDATENSAADLHRLLEHFWSQRKLARALFLGPMRRRGIAVLVSLVEQKLRSSGLARQGILILPLRLVAVQLAEGMLAPIVAWLAGESRRTSEALSIAIVKITKVTPSATAGEDGPKHYLGCGDGESVLRPRSFGKL